MTTSRALSSPAATPAVSGDAPREQHAAVVPPEAGHPPEFAARVEGASKVYDDGARTLVALDHVTVGFARGRFTAIMGPSGSGPAANRPAR